MHESDILEFIRTNNAQFDIGLLRACLHKNAALNSLEISHEESRERHIAMH